MKRFSLKKIAMMGLAAMMAVSAMSVSAFAEVPSDFCIENYNESLITENGVSLENALTINDFGYIPYDEFQNTDEDSMISLTSYDDGTEIFNEMVLDIPKNTQLENKKAFFAYQLKEGESKFHIKMESGQPNTMKSINVAVYDYTAAGEYIGYKKIYLGGSASTITLKNPKKDHYYQFFISSDEVAGNAGVCISVE